MTSETRDEEREPRAHYLTGPPDPQDYANELAKVPPADPADRGAVWVMDGALRGDMWHASWQRGNQTREFDGTRDETMSWARAQEASHYWIALAGNDTWVPMERSTDARSEESGSE